MKASGYIKSELNQAAELLEMILNDHSFVSKVEEASKVLVQAFEAGGQVISCGNGGSMSDAMHFAEELSGKFRQDRKALPAQAIADPSFITCVANDFGYAKIFSRYLEAHGRKGDVLLAISTSGNSGNVVEAVKTAKSLEMTIIGLTGNKGGAMADLVDLEIRVPHIGHADRIQEVHIKVIHILISLVEQALFGKS